MWTVFVAVLVGLFMFLQLKAVGRHFDAGNSKGVAFRSTLFAFGAALLSWWFQP